MPGLPHAPDNAGDSINHGAHAVTARPFGAMATIEEILTPERVRSAVPAASRKRILEILGEIFADASPQLSSQAVFDRLVERERLGSTGLGQGCALPHARVPGLGRALAAFLRVEKGVDFDSPDHEPVDLVFGLLVPEESTDEHLELLAAVARMFSDAAVRASIRSANEPMQMREVLVGDGIGVDPPRVS